MTKSLDTNTFKILSKDGWDKSMLVCKDINALNYMTGYPCKYTEDDVCEDPKALNYMTGYPCKYTDDDSDNDPDKYLFGLGLPESIGIVIGAVIVLILLLYGMYKLVNYF